jgi:hypothetical protein
MEMSGQHHVKAILSPLKELRYSLYVRLIGPQNQSGRYRGEEKVTPTGNRTPTLQQIGRRYNYLAILTH